ncbi:MAG: hypothetical protein BJG00_013410 [Limnothrix sp. CACIAM 69d]|nr:MAG: hypothetical protein BJG00_013410 [Limnothrix sp. CACIAM 69d]
MPSRFGNGNIKILGRVVKSPETLMILPSQAISRRDGVSPPSSRDPWVFPGVDRVVAIARVRVGRPNPYGDGNDDRP